jgi:hypothetical protein
LDLVLVLEYDHVLVSKGESIGRRRKEDLDVTDWVSIENDVDSVGSVRTIEESIRRVEEDDPSVTGGW